MEQIKTGLNWAVRKRAEVEIVCRSETYQPTETSRAANNPDNQSQTGWSRIKSGGEGRGRGACRLGNDGVRRGDGARPTDRRLMQLRLQGFLKKTHPSLATIS